MPVSTGKPIQQKEGWLKVVGESDSLIVLRDGTILPGAELDANAPAG